MERRFLVAVTLMIAVLVVPSFFIKRQPPRRPAADTSAAVASESLRAIPETARATPPPPVMTPAATRPAQRSAESPVQAAAPAYDTVTLSQPVANYRFSTAGGVIDRVEFPAIKSFNPADQQSAAQLLRPGDRLLVRRLVRGRDTIRLDSVPFTSSTGNNLVRLSGSTGALTESVEISAVSGRPYLIDVRGQITGLEGQGALLVVGLGHGFRNLEADSMDNYNNYGVSTRRDKPENVNFRSVDPMVVRPVDGPFDWVAVKSKYFIGALLSADSSQPQIGGAILIGEPRVNRVATGMQTWVTMPVGPDGRYHYQLYLGPQTHQTLSPLGRRLDEASPYGWIFKPIVMPVAGLFTRLLIWMHDELKLSYGIALIVFGILVRLVLWPLNQKAMKSQVAMMAVQPILKDLQTRYKNDPQKLQAEMMKVYKEHNVNPLGGCLPLLLPMPVLLALFFVFSRAIELRGTPFLWLPDLSLRDPLFITPVAMGLSMYALSKLSQAGMPPNPQAKMMTIVMPIMMTVLFLNFASGLNLYYAVSNIVSLPQQYLINKSRMAEMTRRNVKTK